MTQAHERSATLSQMVAEEIRALMARRRVSGRQLAGELGVSPSWVSYRLTGTQPIDINDLMLIAKALGVGVHDLLPPPDVAAGARDPRITPEYAHMVDQPAPVIVRPPDNRPNGRPGGGPARTTYADRPGRRPRGR